MRFAFALFTPIAPMLTQKLRRVSRRQIILLFNIGLSFGLAQTAIAQDDEFSIDSINIPQIRVPLCFGITDIGDLRAQGICDALSLDQNVKARELSEQWIRNEPDNPGAQFALAEVLFNIEGNMPRALFHLNRAEELTNYQSMEDAVNSGQVQWHYLSLSQLSYVHQLMGDQLRSLEYLEKLHQIYGQDVESFRGWPLIKLGEYDAARASANRVLQETDNDRERARAWNTLCAADLASLRPVESITACEQTMGDDVSDYDTVYLTNASEVSLSLLRMDKAEEYLDRATRVINADSVSDPWIYKLYLTMNQGRFDEAREALDRMLIWRESQDPIVNVMNRAEHFMVSASFLILAGYAEDAINLTSAALNQPDRNGSYSADAAQNDATAALINRLAYQTEIQIQLEIIATMDFTEAMKARLEVVKLQLNAWRVGRRAASLFADVDVLQNRLRPYAPLDVHIPEWIEPGIIELIGPGVMSNVLEQANTNGAFMLNAGYYHAYKTQIAALQGDRPAVLAEGNQALSLLPPQEVLLRARLSALLADAAWHEDEYAAALAHYTAAFRQDPSIIRRLALALPVSIEDDGSDFAATVASYIRQSPRFDEDRNGLSLTINSSPDLSLCLNTRTGNTLSCYTMSAVENQDSKWNAQQLTRQFHTQAFGLGYDISKAQRSILLGSSVILSSQTDGNLQRNRETVLDR